MKLVISTTGRDLDAEVDPRFGRCRYFLIVDPEKMTFDVMENGGADAGGGAGVATAQAIASKNADVVITGNCGPNAYQVLSASGMSVVTGASGKVSDAITGYISGKLQPVSQPNVAAHSGMRRRMGRGWSPMTRE